MVYLHPALDAEQYRETLATRIKSVVLRRHDIGTVPRSGLHLVQDGVPGTMCYLAKAQYFPASGALKKPSESSRRAYSLVSVARITSG